MKTKLLRYHPDLLQEAFDFFTAETLNPPYYSEIKEYCMTNPIKGLYANDLKLLDGFGYLSAKDFLMYATEKKKIKPTSDALVDMAIHALVDQLIIAELKPGVINNSMPLFKGHPDMAKYFKENDILFNKIFGFDYIAAKYSRAVYKIQNIVGDEIGMGNGILLRLDSGRMAILTNHHVIDKADCLIVENSTNEIIPLDESLTISDPTLDLALLFFKEEPNEMSFIRLGDDPPILSEVLTIGYPRIPFTNHAYPLFHLGEINSLVQDCRNNPFFIFSAKSNPGSSGGPIISESGMLSGVMTQHFDEQEGYKKGKLPYYAGIPASVVKGFLAGVKI